MFQKNGKTAEAHETNHLSGIREMVRNGETANLDHWGDGKFVVGENGRWHYEGLVNVLQALYEAMRAADPALPPGLPSHCLDPKVIAKFFRIPLEKMNWQGKPETPKPAPPRPKIESPYLDAQQAADYLGLTVKALYGHVERRRLKPMPGYKKYRFTREQLDAFLRGEKPK